MNKDRFIFLLRNYASLTGDETMELADVQKKFPFSQVVHSLVAKGAIINNLGIKEEKLHKAAVYITDRTVLKSIAAAPRTDRISASIPVEPKAAEKTQSNRHADAKPAAIEIQAKPKEVVLSPVDLEGDQLIDDLYRNLDKLKHLKHDFETMVYGKVPMKESSDVVSKVKSKTEKPKKKKVPSDGIIDQIKSSKKKIKPSDPKQKEQLNIINQFIKSKPGFNKSDQVPADVSDLSETSNVFGDTTVSETLAEILIKQGKKEKAIEILKKLIWKFPQKKAYFTSQIEELKK